MSERGAQPSGDPPRSLSSEVLWDGTTVWVNGPQGTAIGPPGRMGIDVHTADGSGCMHCTHEPTDTEGAWCEFVADIARYHSVTIPPEARPARCAPTAIRVIDGCSGGGSCQC